MLIFEQLLVKQYPHVLYFFMPDLTRFYYQMDRFSAYGWTHECCPLSWQIQRVCIDITFHTIQPLSHMTEGGEQLIAQQALTLYQGFRYFLFIPFPCESVSSRF